MDEQNKDNETPFDAELEIIKLQGRFRWVVAELEVLQQKDRSLSARISRLKLKSLEELEEEGESLEGPERQEVRRELDDMTLEERAVILASLIDRE